MVDPVNLVVQLGTAANQLRAAMEIAKKNDEAALSLFERLRDNHLFMTAVVDESFSSSNPALNLSIANTIERIVKAFLKARDVVYAYIVAGW